MEAFIAEREAHGAYREPRGPVPAPRSAEGQSARARGADPVRQPRWPGRQSRHADAAAAAAMQLGEQNSKAQRGRPERHVRPGGGDRARGRRAAANAPEQPEWSERGAPARRARDARACISPAIRSTASRADLAALRHRTASATASSDRPHGEAGCGFGGGKPVTVAGVIDEVRKRGPRTILTLDDRTGRLEVTLFDEVFQQLPRADGEGRAGARRGQAALRRVQRRLASARPRRSRELDKAARDSRRAASCSAGLRDRTRRCSSTGWPRS